MAKKFATVDTIEDTKDYSVEAYDKMKEAAKSLDDVITAAKSKLDSYRNLESGGIVSTLSTVSSSLDSSGGSVEGGAENVPVALMAQVEAAVAAVSASVSSFNSQLTSGLKNEQTTHKTEVEKNKNVIETFTAF